MDDMRGFIEETVLRHVNNLNPAMVSIEEKNDMAGKIADEVMGVIYEEYRSLDEVQQIVDLIKAGENVRVDYYDSDEDDNPYVYKACW